MSEKRNVSREWIILAAPSGGVGEGKGHAIGFADVLLSRRSQMHAARYCSFESVAHFFHFLYSQIAISALRLC